MRVSLLLLFAAPGLIASAQAETIAIEPGQWAYEYSALLSGLPLKDHGRECIAKEDAALSLQSGAARLGKACRVHTIRPIDNGYAFTLACAGDIQGEAEGQVISTGAHFTLSLVGMAGSADAQLPFRFDAEASREGYCTG